jgi:hypothetical protein
MKELRKDFGPGECLNCGGSFRKARSHQKFCKDSCRVQFWVKKHVGVTESQVLEIVDKQIDKRVKPEALK